MVNSINLVNSIEQVQKAKSGVKAWEEEVMNRAGALIPTLSKKSKDVTYIDGKRIWKCWHFANCCKETLVNKASMYKSMRERGSEKWELYTETKSSFIITKANR